MTFSTLRAVARSQARSKDVRRRTGGFSPLCPVVGVRGRAPGGSASVTPFGEARATPWRCQRDRGCGHVLLQFRQGVRGGAGERLQGLHPAHLNFPSMTRAAPRGRPPSRLAIRPLASGESREARRSRGAHRLSDHRQTAPFRSALQVVQPSAGSIAASPPGHRSRKIANLRQHSLRPSRERAWRLCDP